jgi:hypothetical protein
MEYAEYRIKPQPHKWQKEMDAQKAGKIVQFRCSLSIGGFSRWYEGNPSRGGWKFDGVGEYRIKPEVFDVWCRCMPGSISMANRKEEFVSPPNLKLSFEEGKLIGAEIL